jgi:signal transduction histidine kinase
MGERQEISGLRKNGLEFPAEAAIAKIGTGDTVVYSVVLRDITDQVVLHRRLQRAVQARDDTVGVVAHDLRNPVSAVKMLSKALLERTKTEEFSAETQEQLSLIRDAALQMDRLIQDLLDVTRVETGRMGINPLPVTTTALLDGALGTLRPLVQEAGLKLIEDLPASLPLVSADPERIGQVLSNLVGNAIKFTKRGGQVIIRANTNGDREVAISISDSGVGIAGEQLPNIFDRYWQTSQVAIRARGAGLGLPIARGIVHAHGGRMWVESKIGEGSTFYFTLPVATAD